MRKLLTTFIIAGLLIANPGNAFAAAQAKVFNIEKTNVGVLTVNYQQTADKVNKLLVEKDGVRYTYDLQKTGATQNFPLQLGDGQYTVRLAELVDGTKYKEVAREVVTVKLTDAKAPYLQAVQEINWNANNQAVKLAADLVKGLNNDFDKVNAIYTYVINNIDYDYAKAATVKTGYLPNIDQTLTEQKGICYDYAALVAAMLRSQGIPAKLVKGYAPNIDGYHAWNEVYVAEQDRWITIDTVYDAIAAEKNNKPVIEKDKKLFTVTEEI